jgi:hypothetical protein
MISSPEQIVHTLGTRHSLEVLQHNKIAATLPHTVSSKKRNENKCNNQHQSEAELLHSVLNLERKQKVSKLSIEFRLNSLMDRFQWWNQSWNSGKFLLIS